MVKGNNIITYTYIHIGLIVGVVVPVALLVRFPHLIAVVLRLAMVGFNSFIVLLLSYQGGSVMQLSSMLWRNIVLYSEMKKKHYTRKSEWRKEHVNTSNSSNSDSDRKKSSFKWRK